MKPQSRKTIQNRLDKNWSIAIRGKAGNKCEKCGAGVKVKEYKAADGKYKTKTIGIEAHHLIPRAFKRTRWSLANGVCLCSSCHHFRGAHSDSFLDQIEYHSWFWKFWESDRFPRFGSFYDIVIESKAWGSKPLPIQEIRLLDDSLKLIVKGLK
jgi:hypothetical protein